MKSKFQFSNIYIYIYMKKIFNKEFIGILCRMIIEYEKIIKENIKIFQIEFNQISILFEDLRAISLR